MASENVPSTPTKSARGWTDGEKLAVVMQVIAQNGANPKWDSIKVPEGRTVKAAMHVWQALKKQADTVPLTDPASTPSRKRNARSTKPKTAVGETGTKKKRAVKGKRAMNFDEPNDEEDIDAELKLEEEFKDAQVKGEDNDYGIKDEEADDYEE
ncbi:hypothetical protein L228DRAFT_265646 [Xylona heveae TC161]|uniref:Myb-like domain-containing protein n=1 Tax=Xylona heveae (strain CBS 132557 / TC161) TaxID=1328760 RepID=A0A165INY0_XYLHT|nr:hypothetical protein L228DRAFT_265646 [Xylona heveae TC161]KZF25172.1 hypothetical protein L228DRAFT_265646 [Xylona heveae TC161]